MLDNGIARRLVRDIPNTIGATNVCRGTAWKQVVQTIPKQLCSFNDSKLDFSEYNEYHNTSGNIIDMNRCPEDARLVMKYWVLDRIDLGNKPSTVKHKCYLLSRILNEIERGSGCHKLIDITTMSVINAIDTIWQQSTELKKNALSYTIDFLYFCRDDMKMLICLDIKLIEKRRQFLADVLAGYGEVRHSPVIDDTMWQELIDGYNDVMRDESISIDDRITAGMTLLDTQIGLRISEIPALEKDCIHTHQCDDGTERNYIIYNCIKKARYDTNVVRIETFCTELAKNTVEYILDLRKQIAGANNNRFLYIQNNEISKSGKVLPVSYFREHYIRVTARHMTHVVNYRRGDIRRIEVGKNHLWIPKIHSFRSTFADKLYRQGFNIDYINCILSHVPVENDKCNDAYIPSIKKNSIH